MKNFNVKESRLGFQAEKDQSCLSKKSSVLDLTDRGGLGKVNEKINKPRDCVIG